MQTWPRGTTPTALSQPSRIRHRLARRPRVDTGPYQAPLTRAEVVAQYETLETIRTGDILAAGDSELKRNELAPQLYAKAQAEDAAVQRNMAETSAQDVLIHVYQ